MFEVFRFITITPVAGIASDRVIFAGRVGSKYGTWELDIPLAGSVNTRQEVAEAASKGFAMWGHYEPQNEAQALADLRERERAIFKRMSGTARAASRI